jgi:hypothetical protein
MFQVKFQLEGNMLNMWDDKNYATEITNSKRILVRRIRCIVDFVQSTQAIRSDQITAIIQRRCDLPSVTRGGLTQVSL